MLKIVNRELDEMKKRNELAEKIFTIEAERLENIQKELTPDITRMITRFQKLLNFKLEEGVARMMRNSLENWADKLRGVLNKYLNVMDIDLEKLAAQQEAVKQAKIEDPQVDKEEQSNVETKQSTNQQTVSFKNVPTEQNLNPTKFDFQNLKYDDLLEYQMRTQYDEF